METPTTEDGHWKKTRTLFGVGHNNGGHRHHDQRSRQYEHSLKQDVEGGHHHHFLERERGSTVATSSLSSDDEESSPEKPKPSVGEQEKGEEEDQQNKPQSNQQQQEQLPPEGGIRAWLTVAGAAAAMFCSFGWTNCIGLFQAEYQTNQLKAYSASDVSWITSMEFFFMLFFSPLAGKSFDDYGPRIPLAVGTVLEVLGLMMTSLSTEYYQIMLSQSVCAGIGASFIFTPAMTAPQTYFRQKRALVGGLTVAGSSLGGVIFPLMVQHLLPQVGFAWTMRICAFLILALLVFANLAITSNLRHAPRPFSVMDYVRPLREPKFRCMCVASFFLYWGMFVPFNYIVTEAIRYGTSTYLALSLVPIMNGASFIGRIVPNLIADKMGRFNVMIIMTLGSCILVLALWLPGRGDAAIVTFAVLFGITSGAGIGLGPVLIVSISPMKELGYRMGTILSLAAIGVLTSPPIAGAIVADSDGSYVYAAVFSGASFFLATVGVVVLRSMLVGWKWNIKI